MRPGVVVAAAFVLIAASVMAACSGGGSDPETQTPATPTPVPSGTITATGSIAYITPDKELALIEPDGAAQQVIYGAAEVVAFEWSPDGSLIAIDASAGGGRKIVMLTPNGDVSFEFAASSDPLWSPLGDHLLVMRGDEAVVIDTAGQEIASMLGAAMPTWSPDGAKVAYLKVGDDGMAVPSIVTLDTGEERPLASDIEPAEPVYPIAWHPAGDVIAYKDSLYEPATGTVQPLVGVPVEWSPDGRLLLQTTDTDPATGSTTGQLLDFTRAGEVIVGLDIRPNSIDEPPWLYIGRWTDWSNDGRFLFYLDPESVRVRARLYDVSDTINPTQQLTPNVTGTEPDISPSVTHAVFFDGGKVWVWALDESALVNIAEGTYPAWRP